MNTGGMRFGRCILIEVGHHTGPDHMLYLAPIDDKEPTPEELDAIGQQLYRDLLARGYNDSLYEARRFVRNPKVQKVAVTLLEEVHMSMTKRNYEAIAARLKERREALAANKTSHTAAELVGFDKAVRALADYCVQDNYAFRPAQFYEACGLPVERHIFPGG